MNKERAEIYKVNINLEDKNDVRVIAFDHIQEYSNVLDVGCACGDFGKLIHSKKCDVYGMEYDLGSVTIALSTKAYKEIHQIDLNNLKEQEYKRYLKFFDTITLLDVLEHLLKPEQALKKLIKFLKKDGYFIISLPNISFCEIKADILKNNFTYTDTGIIDKTHLKFYTHKTISEMLSESGLEIIVFQPKIAYFSISKKMKLPFLIKRYIKKDPHSFVYQYVLKVIVSKKNKEELSKINSEMINLNWSSISFTLNKIKKRYWIQNFFPHNSFQYRFMKKIILFKESIFK